MCPKACGESSFPPGFTNFVASERNWENPETGELLGIEGLRGLLETEASKVMSDMGNSVRLLIKVLDLRPRLSAVAGGLVK